MSYPRTNVLNSTRISPFVRSLVSIFLLVGVLFFGIRGILILSLQSSTPMRGVSSGSMHHTDNGWKDFYIERGINPENFPLQNGIQKGDLIFIKGVDSFNDIQVGDVVMFGEAYGKPIVHRVYEINLEEGYICTHGDALDEDQVEIGISFSEVKGKVVFSIPYLGYPSIWTG